MKSEQFHQLSQSIEPLWDSFSKKLTSKIKNTIIAPEVVLKKGQLFLKEITKVLLKAPQYNDNQLKTKDIHHSACFYTVLNGNIHLEHTFTSRASDIENFLDIQLKSLLEKYPKKIEDLPTETVNSFSHSYKITLKTHQLLHVLHYQESDSETKYLFVYDYNFQNRHDIILKEDSTTNTYKHKIREFQEYYKEYQLNDARVDEKEMADKLGMPLYIFKEFIKNTTGYTLWRYHLDQRLQKALHDLIFLNKTYDQISHSYGFNGYKELKRAFEYHYKTKLSYIKENIKRLS